MTARFACYNIQYGFGVDGKFDLPRIADAVSESDIIALQEVTRGFPANGGVDLVAELRRLLPGRFAAVGMATDIDAGSATEAGVVVERRFQFGNMVLTRWPIVSVRNHLLPRLRRTGRVNLQRGALETVIAVPGGPVRIVCVHLDHVDAGERLEQIGALKRIVADYHRCGGAVTGLDEFGYPDLPVAEGVMVMGDFNMTPGSPEYGEMAGAGQDLLADISAADPGFSFFNPKESPPEQRLDYVFADPATTNRAGGFRIDRKAQGSDHLPLHFNLD